MVARVGKGHGASRGNGKARHSEGHARQFRRINNVIGSSATDKIVAPAIGIAGTAVRANLGMPTINVSVFKMLVTSNGFRSMASVLPAVSS